MKGMRATLRLFFIEKHCTYTYFVRSSQQFNISAEADVSLTTNGFYRMREARISGGRGAHDEWNAEMA